MDFFERAKQGGLADADFIKFNKEQGQKSDIWTVGQILSSILGSAYQEPVELNAVWKTLKLDGNNDVIGQKTFKENTFKKIATEWSDIKKTSLELETLRLWDIVRLMLKGSCFAPRYGNRTAPDQ